MMSCFTTLLGLNLKGDPEWMKNANKEKVEFVMLDKEMVDARGNVVKLKGKKKSEMTRKERMAYDKRKKMAEEMDDDWEWHGRLRLDRFRFFAGIVSSGNFFCLPLLLRSFSSHSPPFPTLSSNQVRARCFELCTNACCK